MVERALIELRAAGARPRSVVRTGVAALTPSERRVAELAAGGRSNREIAGELFVTKATVETHLRSVFRKLDIRSRNEISDRLVDDNLRGAAMRKSHGGASMRRLPSPGNIAASSGLRRAILRSGRGRAGAQPR